MEVVIESVTGHQTHLTVNPLETVKGLKTRIWKKDGVPLSQQSLIFKNQEMDDSRQLRDYNISPGCTVKLVIITRAGPITVRDCSNEFSMSNLVDLLENASLPGTSADLVNRIGLMVFRDNDHLTWYQHFLDADKQDESIVDPPLTSQQNDPSNPNETASKIEARKTSATKRAEENYRTMMRMRELRHSMERLNIERSRRRQVNGIEPPHPFAEDAANNRLRRSSGSTSATGSRLRQSKGFPVSNAFLICNANAPPHFLSAAEDTSAKESSAGETEFEDCRPTYNLPPLHNNPLPDDCNESLLAKSIGSNNKAPKNLFHSLVNSVECAPSLCSTSMIEENLHNVGCKRLVVKRDATAKGKMFRSILSSSCSDLELDSSLLVSSEHEEVGDLDDQELFTADDFQLGDEHVELYDEEQQELCSSDYQDATEHDYDSNESSSAGGAAKAANSVLGTKTVKNMETTASDPSEFSSGAIVCDLAANNRRSKVRRRNFVQRGLNKRPQVSCRAAPIYESEEHSGNLEFSSFRLNGVEFATRQRAAHQLRFAPRRARSKPRLSVNKPAASTGESSSDERDKRDSSPGENLSSATTSRNVNAVKSVQSNSTNWKQKGLSSVRVMSVGKKISGDKWRPSFGGGLATSASSYAVLSTSPTPSSSLQDRIGLHRNHKLPQSSQSQSRCNICGCRLNISTTFQCRCGKTVCPRHRNSDLHACGNELRRDPIAVITTDPKKQPSHDHVPKF